MALEGLTTVMTPRPFPAAPLAILVGAGALLYVAAIAWSGSSETIDAVRRLGIGTIVVGTLVASCAYVIRFARCIGCWSGWAIGCRCCSTCASICLAWHLRRRPASLARHSARHCCCAWCRPATQPRAFFADRLSDVIGVALLGVVAGWLAVQRQPLLEILALAVVICSLGLRALICTRWWRQCWNGSTERADSGV